MFETGNNYSIAMLERKQDLDGEWHLQEESHLFRVTAVEGNLIKLLKEDLGDQRFQSLLVATVAKNGPREVILNTASMVFIKAERVPA